jgi:hypothetical protein
MGTVLARGASKLLPAVFPSHHGAAFLGRYWYLTIFYFTPWLTFVPTALLLRREQAANQ